MPHDDDSLRMPRRRALWLLSLGFPAAAFACAGSDGGTRLRGSPSQGGSAPDGGTEPPATGSNDVAHHTQGDDGGDPSQDIPSKWEQYVAALEAEGVYTASNPGKWKSKEGTHVPKVQFLGDRVRVTVPHEMRITAVEAGPPHYITTLYIKSEERKLLGIRVFNGSEAAPEAEFPVPPGTKTIVAFAHCNIHGVWSQLASVDGKTSDTDGGTGSDSSKSDPPSTPTEAERWRTRADELEALGLYSANNEGPFRGKAAKHIPVLERAAGAVMVSVPHEMREMRPASYWSEGSPPHFIGAIYLRDASGNVLGMKEFKPTDAIPVALFPLPPGTKTVVAYAWCNLHGTWRSAPLNVNE